MPGTKVTSSYRGVSLNGSTGMWTAVGWNPQTRIAQHIGDYTTELEVTFGSDAPHAIRSEVKQLPEV